MDAVMQDHMKFDQYKVIEYRVLELLPSPAQVRRVPRRSSTPSTLTLRA